MTNDRALPLLIIAQSARFLAQAAQQSGYRVWAADCFGDADTLSAVERWQVLPAFDTLSTKVLFNTILQLSQSEPCQLIYGGGMEYYPDVFDQLPNHIALMGNSSQTLRLIKEPTSFFALLAKQKIDFPEVSWCPPDSQEGWLFKPNMSLGGCNILPAKQALKKSKGYFQRSIQGISISALFLANGTNVQLIGINRQKASPSSENPFRLGSIEKPHAIDSIFMAQLAHAIKTITLATGLVGLNSLDAILANNGKLYFLEINPRPSASAELYNAEYPLISSHLLACQKQNSPTLPEASQNKFSLLRYVYSIQPCTIPSDFNWPPACRDIPPANTQIGYQDPICSLYTHGDSLASCHQQSQQLESEIILQLIN